MDCMIDWLIERNWLYEHFDNVIEKFVQKRKTYQKILPASITRSNSIISNDKTSHYKTEVEGKTLAINLANYKIGKLVTELSEEDRREYQEILMSTRNTNIIFKHLIIYSQS